MKSLSLGWPVSIMSFKLVLANASSRGDVHVCSMTDEVHVLQSSSYPVTLD